MISQRNGLDSQLTAAKKIGEVASASLKKLEEIFFGFNNPSPFPESEEYGYEVWLTVPQRTELSDGVRMKAFPGELEGVIQMG